MDDEKSFLFEVGMSAARTNIRKSLHDKALHSPGGQIWTAPPLLTTIGEDEETIEFEQGPGAMDSGPKHSRRDSSSSNSSSSSSSSSNTSSSNSSSMGASRSNSKSPDQFERELAEVADNAAFAALDAMLSAKIYDYELPRPGRPGSVNRHTSSRKYRRRALGTRNKAIRGGVV
jgi:hypothetical protein